MAFMADQDLLEKGSQLGELQDIQPKGTVLGASLHGALALRSLV